jgi:hypothetical protein
MVRKMVVNIIEESMVLEERYREKAEMQKLSCLRANPLPRGSIFKGPEPYG